MSNKPLSRRSFLKCPLWWEPAWRRATAQRVRDSATRCCAQGRGDHSPTARQAR